MGRGPKVAVRLAKFGCALRPWYSIVAIRKVAARNDPPIEQIGKCTITKMNQSNT